MLSGSEVASHNTASDLWIIIAGQAYDLTEWAPSHPGGMKILLKYAGKDATAEYDPVHPKGTIEETLPKSKHLGPVDMSTVTTTAIDDGRASAKEERLMQLGECLNLRDVEKAAEQRLKTKAFAFYASAADDEFTKNWNSISFSSVQFRPRILVDVSAPADLSTTLLGHKTKMPFFIAPAAMGRLAHPDGELCLARGAAEAGIGYMISANASVGFEDVASETRDQNGLLFYQVYINKDRAKTETQLRKVAAAGYKAICVTVDAPVTGKRERDERAKLDAESVSERSIQELSPSRPAAQGLAQQLGSYVDAAVTWSDLAWIKSITGLPLIVKGIQRADDAALCAHYGVDVIYLSNHGGRQLEGAPSALETLLEIRKFEPWILERCEIWVDGGFRRGTDILKALALGARAVGLGRPFLYSLVFGDQGVNKVIDILRSELAQNLKLLGGTKLEDLREDMVNTTTLKRGIYEGRYQSPIGKAKL